MLPTYFKTPTMQELKNPLRTFKDKPYNQVGEQVIQYLNENKLQAGKVAVFRLTINYPNPDPQKKAGPVIYPNTTLRTSYTIIDPDNGLVDIACGKMEGNNMRVKKYWVDGQYTKGGIFNLHGDNVDDIEVYPYLLLSNENANNPFRDKNVMPKFEIVDSGLEARKKIQRISLKTTCLQAVEMMEMSDIKLYHTANGGSLTDTEDIMRANLMKLADDKPEWFYKMIELPTIKVKSLIKNCIDGGFIQYVATEHKFIYVESGDTIASLDRKDAIAPEEQFASWVLTHKDGSHVQKILEGLLRGAEESKNPVKIKK